MSEPFSKILEEYQTKKWFAKFQFYDKQTDKIHTIQLKGGGNGINYEKKVRNRLLLGQDYCKFLEQELANNWHPILNTFYYKQYQQPYEHWQNKTAIQAIADVFDKKKESMSPDSVKDYGLAIDYFEEAMVVLDLQHTKLKDLKKSTVMTALDVYQEIRQTTDKQYNKNLGYLKAMIEKACEYAEIDYSPARKIKTKIVTDPIPYKTPTDNEQLLIKKKLLDSNYNLYRLSAFLYYTQMREKEALAIKISDIDFERNIITIIRERSRDNAKTKKIRVIPMPDDLVVYLKQMRLNEYPSSYYVFGSPATVGRGWTGIKSKQFYFMPNAVRVKRDTLTKYWRQLIKIELGLDVDMYGLKYKSGDDRLLAGIRLETIQDIYGHSERQMTKGYLSKLQGVQMQEIKDKAPKF